MAQNIGESVKAKLREIARRTETDTSTIQTRYVLERFLYRITCTKWRDSIALKGALIFVVHDGDTHRPTGDIDLNGFTKDGNMTTMRSIVEDACNVSVDDGLEFNINTLIIRKERDRVSVPGGKIELDAKLHTSNIRVRIDMGFGNIITPKAEWAEYPSILQNMPKPKVLVYPYSTMISEKIHAMSRYGAETTRLRDYYDIWSLLNRHNFNGGVMGDAIRGTFNQAEDAIPTGLIDGLSDDFIQMRSSAWDKYRSAKGLKYSPPNLTETVEQLRPFISSILDSAHGHDVGNWIAGNGWKKESNSHSM